MFQFIKPFINNVKNIVSPNYRPRPINPRRVGKFSKKYSFLEKQLKVQNKNLQRTQHELVQGQPLYIKVVKTVPAKVAQCRTVALTAPIISLPKRCVADEQNSFVKLLTQALLANNNKTRITVWELVQYVKKHQHDRTNVAHKFSQYLTNDYKEFRQFSKPWLRVALTERSMAKSLTNFGGPNSAKHGEYLKKLGLTEKNANLWWEELLEDRCYSPIYAFQLAPKGKTGFRVIYHVPIAIRPSSYSQTTYASDSSQFFSSTTDLVNMVLVFEHLENTSKPNGFFFQAGVLITAFLHDKPLKQSDIVNLQWVTKGITPWGGSIGVVNNYIKTLGKTRMPFLGKTFNSFPLLKTAPTPNRSSDGNKIEDKYRNLPGNLNKKSIFISKIDPVTKKISKQAIKDILGISIDPAYLTKAFNQFCRSRAKIERQFKIFWNQL